MIAGIYGSIILDDGSESGFSISSDGGWSQWGANRARLGKTSEAVATMAQALLVDGILWEEPDDSEYDM